MGSPIARGRPTAPLTAILCLTAALAGRTADTQPICEPTRQPENGTGVCFATRDGWVLQGHVWNAEDDEVPSAMLVHGLNEQHARYHDLADRLAADGWRVVAMDTRGHGDSVNLTSGESRTVNEFSNRDLYAVLADLEATQTYFGQAPDLAIGASVGANQVLVHAAEHANVSQIALLSPSMGQGELSASEPNRAYEGAIHYMSSVEDRRATRAVERLSANHTSPHETTVFEEKGHGTGMLDEETIDVLVDWADPS
jgi:alpha-beta hydrolase superfamily lysophospholipase